MRNQKYYDKKIMERIPDFDVGELHDAYIDKKHELGIGGKKTNIGKYHGYLLEMVLDYDWERFKEDYENAKSPTVNNLPREEKPRIKFAGTVVPPSGRAKVEGLDKINREERTWFDYSDEEKEEVVRIAGEEAAKMQNDLIAQHRQDKTTIKLFGIKIIEIERS